MPPCKRFLLHCLLALCTLDAALARTWVVSNSAPGATDSNPGTPEKPLLTINAAARQAEPGDTVLVKAGTYRERVIPAQGGTEDKPIVYQADPAGAVFVKGSDIWTHWQPIAGHPGVYRADIEGHIPASEPNPFRIGISVAPNDQDIIARPAASTGLLPKTLGQVFFDGSPVSEAGAEAIVLAQANSWAATADGVAILAHFPGSPASLADHIIEVSVRNRTLAPRLRGLNYIQIKGFTFEHCANQGSFPQGGSVSTRSGSHWLIENNTIRYAKTIGIDIGSETFDPKYLKDTQPDQKIRMEGGRHVVEGNTVSDNGLSGIVGWHHNGAVIRNNIVERNNALGFNQTDTKWEEWGGIKLHGGGAWIEGNLLRDNEAYGIWIDNDYTDCRITRNIVLNNRMAGIFLELGDGRAVIDNNVVALTRTRDGMYAGSGIYAHDASGLVIAHNLIYGNADCGILLRVLSDRIFTARPVSTPLVHVSNTRILNNIIWDNAKAAISLPFPNQRASDNISDYNVLFSRRDLWLGFEPDPDLFAINLYKSSATIAEVRTSLQEALAKAGIPPEEWPAWKAWQRNPTLNIYQWRLFTGQDTHSKEIPKAVSLVIRPAIPMASYSALPSVLDMQCPQIEGVTVDFLGHPIKPPRIRPGPFQDLSLETTEQILFPVRPTGTPSH